MLNKFTPKQTQCSPTTRSNLASKFVKETLFNRQNGSIRMLSSSKVVSQTSGSSATTTTTNPIHLPKFNNLLLTSPCEHVISIELHKPQAKNAFCLNTAKELIEALNSCDSNQQVRCVILSGSGSDFTSGVDLKSFMAVYAQLQDTEDVAKRAKLLRNVIEQFQAPFKRLDSFSKPVICLMHGLSIGLAMELAACSDIRYCTTNAKLAIREVMIGIAADVGSLQLLPRLMSNQSLLNELIFTGRYLEPSEALDLGFVSRICDSKELAMNEAIETARNISQRSPVAVQGSKVNLRFSRNKSLADGLDYNAVWNMAMMQGGDVVKAVAAIMSRDDDVRFDDF